MISRDKKEFLGDKDDILAKYSTEFGDGNTPVGSTPSPDVSPGVFRFGAPRVLVVAPALALQQPNHASCYAASVNPFGSTPVSADNPFKASTSAPASPFGAAGPPPVSVSPFKKSSVEPVGLRPDMSPDPILKETPVSFLKSITLTQIVSACMRACVHHVPLRSGQAARGSLARGQPDDHD